MIGADPAKLAGLSDGVVVALQGAPGWRGARVERLYSLAHVSPTTLIMRPVDGLSAAVSINTRALIEALAAGRARRIARA